MSMWALPIIRLPAAPARPAHRKEFIKVCALCGPAYYPTDLLCKRTPAKKIFAKEINIVRGSQRCRASAAFATRCFHRPPLWIASGDWRAGRYADAVSQDSFYELCALCSAYTRFVYKHLTIFAPRITCINLHFATATVALAVSKPTQTHSSLRY